MKMETLSKQEITKEFFLCATLALILTIALFFMPSLVAAVVIIAMWLAVFTNLILGFIILSNRRIIDEMRKEDG